VGRVVTIDPVTRIEGHAKISIQLDDQDKVASARLQVTEFRGFEKLCEGRHFSELPTLTERICGICPVSHHLASAKAVDAICNVTPPPTARKLRELMHMGQLVQSHALSFFHLSAPDLLLGFDCDPRQRNVFGLAAAEPEVAREGIGLRRFGQEIIEAVAGRRIHPDVCVPGGMNRPLAVADRDRLLGEVADAKQAARHGLRLLLDRFEGSADWVGAFASFPSNYLALVAQDGTAEYYDGYLRLAGANGVALEDLYDPNQYLSLVAEATEPWSYLKFPYYKPMGYPDGSYRVGPLARLNVCSGLGTPEANRELRTFRERARRLPIEGSLFYHQARLIELLHAVERAERLLADEEICGQELIAERHQQRGEGVGVIEAPRGTLFHHYFVDERGMVERVNLIVATGQNNQAMNQAVADVARHALDGSQLTEPMLDRIEAAVRCYDPCLSCSTHAIGMMPLEVELRAADGTPRARVSRR
jgi:NAD-reducing hydrogenase large subunit